MFLVRNPSWFIQAANWLKVAVPVAVWYDRYESLLSGSISTIRCIDTINKTILMASIAITDPAKSGDPKTADLHIEVSKIEISAEMGKIHKFTQGN